MCATMRNDAQVRFDLRSNPGTPHLEDHLRAIGKPGPMDLGDGSRAERSGLEVGEHLERGPAQRALELRNEQFERHRRYVAVQLLELGNPRWRQQIDTGGQ